MPTVPLPENPSLDHLRGQARGLQRAVRAGQVDAADRVVRQHPDGVPGDAATFSLSAAQLVVAREYGFASWARLKRFLDVVADHGWNSSPPADPLEDPADALCRLACLTYGDDDGPARWERARLLLAEHPGLTGGNIWAAAAAADPAAVGRLLDEDPGRARLRGGPYRWRPLCYLAYSRIDPDVAEDSVLTVARLLLAAGADPNEGYLWNGLPTPFTLLTGVFGEGEQGPARQPRHPHSSALARLLLDAGADPNDGQTLYNRMFLPADDHLELLFDYGLGTGDGGPWKARIGEQLDSPPQLLRVQLKWAVKHHMLDRIRLLVRNGVDFLSPYDTGPASGWLSPDGHTPVELAHLNGDTAIVDYLVSQGAAPPDLGPAGDVIAALLRADTTTVERIRAEHPDAVPDARRFHPALIMWAAAQGRTGAVPLLVELGFDVNARGRGGMPVDQEWETALHHAAARGDVGLARLLLSLGADPDIRDARFCATPLAWARHFGQEPVAELLAPLTAEDPLTEDPPTAQERPG